jgi:hypothetical protein
MSQRADAADEPPGAGEQPIRVLLVDDHAVVRKGLRALLDASLVSRGPARPRTANRRSARRTASGRT